MMIKDSYYLFKNADLKKLKKSKNKFWSEIKIKKISKNPISRKGKLER